MRLSKDQKIFLEMLSRREIPKSFYEEIKELVRPKKRDPESVLNPFQLVETGKAVQIDPYLDINRTVSFFIQKFGKLFGIISLCTIQDYSCYPDKKASKRFQETMDFIKRMEKEDAAASKKKFAQTLLPTLLERLHAKK